MWWCPAPPVLCCRLKMDPNGGVRSTVNESVDGRKPECNPLDNLSHGSNAVSPTGIKDPANQRGTSEMTSAATIPTAPVKSQGTVTIDADPATRIALQRFAETRDPRTPG